MVIDHQIERLEVDHQAGILVCVDHQTERMKAFHQTGLVIHRSGVD